MVKSDFHMHSYHSGDSKSPTEEMIKQSIAKGLTDICFTEHQDMDFIYTDQDWPGKFEVKTEEYLNEVIPLSVKYQNQINVGHGVELGLQPHLADRLHEYVQKYDFDFVIGSSHLCHRKDPYYSVFFEGRTEKEAFGEYFESILENINLINDFDVYGHLDYVARYAPDSFIYNPAEYFDIFEEIFKKLSYAGKGIELNTGGFFSKLGNTNPCGEIVKFYRECGGEIITVGADAHVPERIAYGFDKAYEMLIESGFNHYCIYKKRKPVFIALK